MSSNSQIENMVGTWSDLQEQLWRGWLDGWQLTPSGWWKQNYRIPLEICEEMVNLGLQAQSQYTQICTKGMQPNEAMPEFVNQVGERMQKTAEDWIEAQRQAWETWFKAAKQWDPTHPSIDWDVPAQNLFQSWQGAAEKTLKMQANMYSLFNGEQRPEVGAKPEKQRVAKKTAPSKKEAA